MRVLRQRSRFLQEPNYNLDRNDSTVTSRFRHLATQIVAVVSVSAFTVLILAGRTPVPRTAEVVGRWVYSEESSNYGPSDGSCQFSSDRTFSCTDFPLELLHHEGWSGPGSISGTWEIVERQVGVDSPGVKVLTDPVDLSEAPDRTRFVSKFEGPEVTCNSFFG